MAYKWNNMSVRERDALVAVHVMRYSVERYKDGTLCEVEWHGGHSHRLQNYTTDISAAWKVVQRMHYSSPDASFNFTQYLPTPIYYVTPEAICIAALRAVGVDIQCE